MIQPRPIRYTSLAGLVWAASLLLAGPLRSQAVLKWPGERLATIDAKHVRAYVPYDQREKLRGLIARADSIYATMCADANFEPNSKLRLLVGDWVDSHNGYSFVTPFPMVQVELTLGYDDSTYYTTSYSPEDGGRLVGVVRRSGFGGDLTRTMAAVQAGYVWSLAPEAGHQVVTRLVAGWSSGERTLQGNYGVGGGLGLGFPRGYLEESVATGQHLLGASLAYRLPIWRPFKGVSTVPLRGRQVALSLFCDTAKVSSDHLAGDGDWFTSVGTEIHLDFEFFDGVLTPGIGIAYQLDGERDLEAYFSVSTGF